MDSGQRRGLAQVQSIAPTPAKPGRVRVCFSAALEASTGLPGTLSPAVLCPVFSTGLTTRPAAQSTGPVGKAHSGKEHGALGTVTSSGSRLLTQCAKAGGTLRSGSEVSRVCLCGYPVPILSLLLRSEPGRGRKGRGEARRGARWAHSAGTQSVLRK